MRDGGLGQPERAEHVDVVDLAPGGEVGDPQLAGRPTGAVRQQRASFGCPIRLDRVHDPGRLQEGLFGSCKCFVHKLGNIMTGLV